MQLFNVISSAAWILAIAGLVGVPSVYSKPTNAKGTCNGSYIPKFHANNGTGGSITAVPDQMSANYTVTIDCIECANGTFTGFVINPSNGNMTAIGVNASLAQPCVNDSMNPAALSHNSPDFKYQMVFTWSGIFPVTFSAVFVDYTTGYMAAPNITVVAPSSTPTPTPSPSPSSSPAALPVASPSPSQAAVVNSTTTMMNSTSPNVSPSSNATFVAAGHSSGANVSFQIATTLSVFVLMFSSFVLMM